MFRHLNVKLTAAAIAIILAAATTGCTGAEAVKASAVTSNAVENINTGSPASTSTTGSKVSEDVEKKAMDGFNELVSANKPLKDLFLYMDEKVKYLSLQSAATVFQKLEELQKQQLPVLEAKFNSGENQKLLSEIYKPELDPESVKDENLKKLLLEARDTGYRIETAEGFYFPIIDYSFYKKYSSGLPGDLREYIEIMSIESGKVPAKDAALVISWEEMLKRTLRQEKFLSVYNNSSKASDIRKLYGNYIRYTLYGLNNTPLFDYENKTVVPDAKAAYEAAAGSTDSQFSIMLKDYVTLLKKANYKLTDEVEKFRKNVEEGC